MDTQHTHNACDSPAAHAAAHSHAATSSASAASHCNSCSHDGHDHGELPSWPRIGAALVLALLAEVAHWFQPQWPALHYVGMALAVVAIGLAGLGIYKMGLKSLFQLKLGIHALMAVAVTGAFLIDQWPEAAMVMALYVAAERIEDRAPCHSRLTGASARHCASAASRWQQHRHAHQPSPHRRYRARSPWRAYPAGWPHHRRHQQREPSTHHG